MSTIKYYKNMIFKNKRKINKINYLLIVRKQIIKIRIFKKFKMKKIIKLNFK